METLNMSTKYLDTLVMGCSVVGILNWMLAKVVEGPIGHNTVGSSRHFRER